MAPLRIIIDLTGSPTRSSPPPENQTLPVRRDTPDDNQNKRSDGAAPSASNAMDVGAGQPATSQREIQQPENAGGVQLHGLLQSNQQDGVAPRISITRPAGTSPAPRLVPMARRTGVPMARRTGPPMARRTGGSPSNVVPPSSPNASSSSEEEYSTDKEEEYDDEDSASDTNEASESDQNSEDGEEVDENSISDEEEDVDIDMDEAADEGAEVPNHEIPLVAPPIAQGVQQVVNVVEIEDQDSSEDSTLCENPSEDSSNQSDSEEEDANSDENSYASEETEPSENNSSLDDAPFSPVQPPPPPPPPTPVLPSPLPIAPAAAALPIHVPQPCACEKNVNMVQPRARVVPNYPNPASVEQPLFNVNMVQPRARPVMPNHLNQVSVELPLFPSHPEQIGIPSVVARQARSSYMVRVRMRSMAEKLGDKAKDYLKLN